MFNLQGNAVKVVAQSLIVSALVSGFLIRVLSTLRYTTFFYYDQARDAEVYAKMWQGTLPILGPSASVGGYHLPPLYYYLVFPFTIFGSDPVFTVIPNALFSFLSIPLLIYLVYQLLENVENSKRLLLSGLAGFWYSLLFPEIFISTFHWNPSPTCFFLFGFTLLYKCQLEKKFSGIKELFAWILYGITLAVLISLHSTNLFVMPVVFVTSSLFFIYKNRRNPKKYWLPAVSVLSAFVALLPYWRGEIIRGWRNSKEILMTLIQSSNEAGDSSIWQRISRLVFNYFELGKQAYFTGDSWGNILITIVVLSIGLYYGFTKFKGNKTILLFLSFTWIVYLYAASNYQGIYYIHYKLLILVAPIILAIASVAYLDVAKKTERWVSGLLVLSILVSLSINLNFDYQYLSSKYSTNRLINTADTIEIFKQLPKKSTVCTFDPKPRGWMNEYQPYIYIDKYVTNKKLKIVRSLCKSGQYLVVPKFYMQQRTDQLFPVFNVYHNQVLYKKLQRFLATPVADVYVLK